MKGQMSTLAIFAIAMIAVAGIFYVMLSGTTKFQVIPESCDETNLNIACSTVQDCTNHFKDLGAPDEWIVAQTFSCKSNSCFGIPSPEECKSTFGEVPNE